MAVTLDKFLEMNENQEKQFHPLAVKNYRRFLDGICKDVDPNGLQVSFKIIGGCQFEATGEWDWVK